MVAQVQKIAQSGHTVDNQIIVHFLKGQSTSEQKKNKKDSKDHKSCCLLFSVTRLGYFRKILVTNFLTKVAQTFGNFLGHFEKCNFVS